MFLFDILCSLITNDAANSLAPCFSRNPASLWSRFSPWILTITLVRHGYKNDTLPLHLSKTFVPIF